MSKQHNTHRHIAFAVFVLLACALNTFAARPAHLFADHMVLQRDLPVPVWGLADPGTAVVVSFGRQVAQGKADDRGHWRITFKPMKANATGRELVVQFGESTKNTQHVIKDVLVGEVWFAGGQSNMAYTAGAMAKRLIEGKAMVASAKYPAVRFRKINERNAPKPRADLDNATAWSVCSPSTVVHHSAVALVFAQRLHHELKIPVGIIDCSWGGTPIEPYIPASAFTGHPTLEKLAALAKKNDPAAVEAIKAMPGGTYVRSDAWLAGAIYNGRIAPVAPYAIRGAIWYQGESNAGRGEDPRDYEYKMRALIKGWRHAFEQKELPFYYVQLPQWKSYAWTYLREEQRRAMDVPNTGMAVTIDLDNANDIHPPNKISVGERLARWPLVHVYKKKKTVSGPLFKKAVFDGNAAVVSFNYADSGLMPGRRLSDLLVQQVDDAPLHGFELTDKEGRWHEATALIQGKTVVVTSPNVKAPIAVRYACHPEATAHKPWNLYNQAGLPASPFCSDWKLMPYDPKKNPMGK